MVYHAMYFYFYCDKNIMRKRQLRKLANPIFLRLSSKTSNGHKQFEISVAIIADFIFYMALGVKLTLTENILPSSHIEHCEEILLRSVRTKIKLHRYINFMGVTCTANAKCWDSYAYFSVKGHKKKKKGNRDLFYCTDPVFSWQQSGKSRNTEAS